MPVYTTTIEEKQTPVQREEERILDKQVSAQWEAHSSSEIGRFYRLVESLLIERNYV